MGLHRMLLRLLTVAALTKQPGEAHAPTIAKDAIFDSRLDPIEFDADKIELPIATVYTEDDRSTLRNAGAGRGAYHRMVSLRVDLAIGTFTKTATDESTTVTYSIPTTDAELEAMLDMFEGQFWRALNTTGRKISDRWQALVQKIETIDSRPTREDKGNGRLAARSLLLSCQIAQDCIPRVDTFTPQKLQVLKEMARKPEFIEEAPYLKDMLSVIPDNPDLLGLLDVLRNAPILMPRLKTMAVDERSFVDSSAYLNLVNSHKPPRKPGDVQSIWTFGT